MTSLPALVEPAATLDNAEIERYSRHIIIPEIGNVGQRRLKNARVLVIGAGGLGSPTILYLAAAGVGTIGIVDFDSVEVSNLQRQVIHGMNDIGRSKLDSARDAVAALNPLVDVKLHDMLLSSTNALALFADYDLIIDGSDNFATRYLVNDAAAILGKPYVWGSVYRFDGQVSVFWQRYGPTYRDLFPEAPAVGSAPSCGEGGVFGMLCAAVGAVMVAEALKLITGVGETLLGRVMLYDALSARWRQMTLNRDPAAPKVTELIDYEAFCGLAQGGAAPAAQVAHGISPRELAELLIARTQGTADFDLIDVREPGEHALVSIPGAQLIPQGKIYSGEALVALSRDRDLVLYCKAGSRSAGILAELHRLDYHRVRNLTGGIAAYTAEIEPSQPRY
ncbi:MAG: adenylyltransferase/sulfurtransferase [Alpinimonas sp.]|jgi:molybdopterin/thiamine biosynthesis adenylyltransferase/rhodanese-related sulfurtransferase